MKDRYTLPVLLLIFTVLSAGILAAGVLLYQDQQTRYRTEVERKLSAVADLKVDELSRWKKERMADSNVFYRNGAFSKLASRFFQRPQDESMEKDLRSWLGRVQESYQYDRIVLFDASGEAHMIVADTKEPLSSATLQKAREVMAAGKSAFDDFRRNEHTGEIHLRIFVPILDGPSGGQPLGAVMLRIDPNTYLYPYIQRWPTPSQTAETLLVRREGDEVVFLNELKYRKDSALSLRVSLDNKAAPAVSAVLGHEGISTGIDYRGVPVLAALRAVPDSPWFLEARMDAAEAFAPLRAQFWQTVFTVGVLLFSAAASVGFVWRQKQLDFYQDKFEVERKYEQVVSMISDVAWRYEVDGRGRFFSSYISPAADQLLGLPEGTIGNCFEKFMSYVHAEQKAAVNEMLFTGLRGLKKHATAEYRLIRPDGATLWVRSKGSAYLQSSGHIVCYGTTTDISSLKKTEESLRETETRLRAVTDSAWDAILVMDSRGAISYWNPAAEKIFGYRAAEALGRNLHELLAPERYHEAYRAGFSEFTRTGRGKAIGKTSEVAARRKDGQEITVEMSLSAIMLHDEWHAVGILRDVTQRKQVEEQLRKFTAELATANAELDEARRAAETANRIKSEFLANMSHEIRTPMTAILGYADLILEENIDGGTREQAVVIKRNGEHLLGLINDILDLSKIEAGKLCVEPTRCSPLDVAAEVVSLLQPQAAAKQLELKTDLIDPLPETVLTDPLRLRQVLLNLVGNAIKFTDRGEVRLAIRLTPVPTDAAFPNALADNQGDPPAATRLRFDVTDTGIGMNDEQIGKLFQPFSQVDNSFTRKFSGTGLGLCISKRLAEALGGNIEVRSQPAAGSTFSLTIDPGPLGETRISASAGISAARAVQSRPATRPAETRENQLSGRILLAEDGEDNQRLIELLLRKAGATVTVVENGRLAVESALAACEAGEPFDVILMDMQMPVMDGYAAARELRARGFDVPIVALTAHAMAEDCQKCLAAGCDDYLTKPLDRHGLTRTVARQMKASAKAADIAEQAQLCPGIGNPRNI